MRHARLVIVVVLIASPLAARAQSSRLVGSDSCAAATCHGGVIDQGPKWNHSLSTWFTSDPHAGAGMLLRDEDSRAIVERLKPEAADSAEVFDSVLRSRCVSCHATVTPEQCEPSGILEDAVLAEGVSCESCHGAAAGWLDAHVQSIFQGPQRFEPEVGMRDTESIAGRAETCVRCHVGSRTADGLVRDMNHDLIAAGHPALRFDLLLYTENLPQHWSAKSAVETEFNKSAIRVRRVGRAVNLAAAATLAGQRAADHLVDPAIPWPELADYDCFACHQSLSMTVYHLPPRKNEQQRSPLRISDGLPIWNSWHTIGQKDLTKSQLQALAPNKSDPAPVARAAPKLATDYRTKAAAHASRLEDPNDVLSKALEAMKSSAPRDWHHAAVQYLQIDAAVRDLESQNEPESRLKRWRKALDEMERMLRFDPQLSRDQSARWQSPAVFSPTQFRGAALRLVDPNTPQASGSNPDPKTGPNSQPTRRTQP